MPLKSSVQYLAQVKCQKMRWVLLLPSVTGAGVPGGHLQPSYSLTGRKQDRTASEIRREEKCLPPRTLIRRRFWKQPGRDPSR